MDADGGRVANISTVWLGIDHGFTREGPPVIFETVVFPEDSMLEDACARYCTETEAKYGHVEMIVEVCKEMTDPIIMELNQETEEN